MFVPKDDSDKRHDHHAVDEEGNEDDDKKRKESRAVLGTEACRSPTVFDTPTAEKLLQSSSSTPA